MLSFEFNVSSGLRQGDVLFPPLFNILKKVIRELSQRQQMEMVDKESILAYADDDIVILDNTRQEITQITCELLVAIIVKK